MKFWRGLIVVLVFVALAFDIGYILILTSGDKHKAYRTTYVSTLENLPERPFVFEFKYFPKDNLGPEMLEAKITAYTDYLMQDKFVYGIQILNPSAMSLTEEHVRSDIRFFQGYSIIDYKYHISNSFCDIVYFNSDDFVSYEATTALNKNNTPYLIDFGGTVYAMNFDKRVKSRTDYTGINYRKEVYYTSNFEYFIFKMYDAIKSIVTGPGIYENLDFQLNDIFNFYSYNSFTGKFDMLSDMVFNSDFIGIKLTIQDRSVRLHEDSMFGRVGSTNKEGGVIFG